MYILKSKIEEQIYIGSTRNLKSRLKIHNSNKEFYSKRYSPWELVYYEAYIKESLARLREKRLKHNGNAIRELKKRIGLLENGAGFTLLELIVVFSVIAIISTVGVVSFSNYNKSQELSQAVSDIVTLLNSAKSNSRSQIKAGECDRRGAQNQPIYTLEGYRIAIDSGEPSTVTLETICIDSNEIECNLPDCKNAKIITLSKNIKITSSDAIFNYRLFQQPVESGSICLEGYGVTKREIAVSNLGTVTLLNPEDQGFSCQ